jgi:hypothetical protein
MKSNGNLKLGQWIKLLTILKSTLTQSLSNFSHWEGSIFEFQIWGGLKFRKKLKSGSWPTGQQPKQCITISASRGPTCTHILASHPTVTVLTPVWHLCTSATHCHRSLRCPTCAAMFFSRVGKGRSHSSLHFLLRTAAHFGSAP